MMKAKCNSFMKKHDSLLIVKDVKAYCTIHFLRHKYIECLDVIKSDCDGNLGTCDTFLDL